MTTPLIPKAFIWRRTHSLLGLWLVIFLFQHLLTNSQAALFFGDDGHGFIHSVNAFHNLPYLPVIEILVLVIPFAIHGLWGIKYLFTAKMNSFDTDGSKPSLPEYGRNQAYSWQRITSWILLFGITAHVIHMRFLEFPVEASQNGQRYYLVKLTEDEGLNTVSQRLGVEIYSPDKIESVFNGKRDQEEQVFALKQRAIKAGEVIAISKDFGTAELLMVRDTFKKPIMMLLYTILVIVSCYHGFNGLWTFMNKWGVTISHHSQKKMLRLSQFLMFFTLFLGLAAIWCTYWINLRN